MPPTQLPLFAKLDLGLTKALRVLLRWCALGGCWLLGLSSLVLMPFGIFTYDEGLSDISLVEAGAVLSLLPVLWRHVRYCRHFKAGFWHSLNRVLLAQGLMCAFCLLLVGLGIWLTLNGGDLQAHIRDLQTGTPLRECLTYASVLLALYLAAPTSNNKPLPRVDDTTIGVTQPDSVYATREDSL
ncbi:hypothetical protein [Pseudomonas farsensis]|uniref:Uncharacterized protein n=1 Tax=Pseudomonas farsensis TaxID=2745492 RepID=A0ABU8QUY5_9PSED